MTMDEASHHHPAATTPKKRFLWRRPRVPILDPLTGWTCQNKNNIVSTPCTSSSSTSSLLKKISSCENPEKVVSRLPDLSKEEGEEEKCSSLLSPSSSPLLDDEGDATTIASTDAVDSQQKHQQRQQSSSSLTMSPVKGMELWVEQHSPKKPSESDTESSISEDSREEPNERDLIINTNTAVEMGGKKSPGPVDSRLVVNTAASVLLLMRYSVSQQTLECLSTSSSSQTCKKQRSVHSCTNEDSTTPIEAQHDHPLHPEDLPIEVRRTVSSTSGPHSCTRRVSLPDSLSMRTMTTHSMVQQDDDRPQCPKRLAMPEDPNELNSLHCFVRKHLLEVFCLPTQKGKPGGVGLRCIYCSHLPRKDRSGTTMCTFYPKSLQDLYRSVMTWQRIHFRACKWVPKKLQEEYWKHKESDQTRGKTTYWVTSAMRLGLDDISNGRNGITFVGSPSVDSA